MGSSPSSLHRYQLEVEAKDRYKFEADNKAFMHSLREFQSKIIDKEEYLKSKIGELSIQLETAETMLEAMLEGRVPLTLQEKEAYQRMVHELPSEIAAMRYEYNDNDGITDLGWARMQESNLHSFRNAMLKSLAMSRPSKGIDRVQSYLESSKISII